MDDKHLTDIERRLRENYADILRLDIIAYVRALAAEIRVLKTFAIWMDGSPPADAFVWRESAGFNHPVHTSHRDGVLSFLSAHDPGGWQPWGTARWAPIPKPSDKAPEPKTSPDARPSQILDGMTIEQIEAYLEQRKRDEFLSCGCADGFERLPMEQDHTTLILQEGCWVWRDASGSIRRAFGYLDAPHWSQTRLCWATFDDWGREIAFGRLTAIPSAVPVNERALSSAAWLADIRAWLLTQPIERLTSA